MSPSAIRYLHVAGRLYPDNQFALRPCFVMERPARAGDQKESPVAAELLAGDGRLLVRAFLGLGAFPGVGGDAESVVVHGRVPFHPDTRVIRFVHRGLVVHELVRSAGTPEVRLTWAVPQQVQGRHEVKWEGSHPEGRPLQYRVRYSYDDGATWQGVCARTEATRLAVDFDALPGGSRCRLAVLATDGVNTSVAESRPFTVAVKGCSAIIMEPVDGSVVGGTIWFRGQGWWVEEREPETEALTWESSIVGHLGRGSVLPVTGLTPGRHRITLTAGAGPRAGIATLSITVTGSPELPSGRVGPSAP